MRNRKIMGALAGVILLAGLGYWLWPNARGTEQAPTTAVVSRGDISETVLATGQVGASRLVSVGARVSGQIEELAVSLGQQVEKGALVASIDSSDQANEVRQTQANLANIKAQIVSQQADLKRAEMTLHRQARLGKSNYSAQETVDSAQTDVDMLKAGLVGLQAQMESAEIEVSNAQISLERTRITAPISGTVVAMVQQQGATVNAMQSAPTIVKLADLDRVLVKAEISEADVVSVKAGQPVAFTILGQPDKIYRATLLGVEPAPAAIKDSDTIESGTAIYYNGIFEVDNPDHLLRIGMTAQVTITLAEVKDALTVPASALTRTGKGYQVRVYNGLTGQSQPRDVTVGLNNKVTAQIISGVEEGDRVVVGGAARAAGGGASANRMPPMRF